MSKFNNNISVIGTGYVGLVSGACLSEFGMNVICMDKDADKIEKLRKGEIPIYEPGLYEIVKKNVDAGRLNFTTDFKYAVENSQVIFIAVGTPPLEDGSADLQYVLSASEEIAEYINDYKIIVDKSTVPVGTGKKVKRKISEVLNRRGVEYGFDIVSNPEFLREGAAVKDFTHPDRVVIGVESKKAEEIMKQIYKVLYLISVPFVVTNLETAEMIKYASNAFLATKISFINEMANICEHIGADVHHVAKAMGLDGRIGLKFLHPGPGYGGSCFPKDTQALARIAKQFGSKSEIIETVIKVNENQKERMVEKIKVKLEHIENKKVALLGLAFKPETDDLRESPALYIAKRLIEEGVQVNVYDPIAMENCRKLYPKLEINYCKNEYEACEGVHVVVLATEWNQFRSLNLTKIIKNMSKSIFIDLRNVYDPWQMKELGFEYEGVGRK
ncbi:UDP-glucose/GDP-mannose dehydrogenase family protein [Clostridium botulinum]|uniref:UDP-glucose dehydrogenase family protein n=1 Tax=Clostridium botulinum TaxID=1491 RepID=UPI0013CBB18E|nr:UDP-glucose/GDP-mannose dehydrogenase family protein [Clostridium botulinum]MBY6836406.1 UDP-glucose/GDP-mannose dehydrogenase family protein [Clostridium botulinum]NFG64250.1 UDP-glucose/GDP-mannose dehydrogenase family protein [Clostridium botulinum]NFN18147.1 UDP-glucose/GDP-mannose dehydrogenase family protein [Clostridium botulinum]NFN47800.1 UDP-glucose/GDP-mannose dehydrogenase family protein [Clostridium botulinum]NFQ23022.1 UDP-glucose/GDP-mannose dehydrogenase family protein [Clos